MRIVQTCPYGWDDTGGVQVHIASLARHLAMRGHEVMVLAPGSSQSSNPDVVIVGRPMRVRFNGSVAPICPSPWSALRVARALDAFNPDIVHVHEPLVPSTSMMAAMRTPAGLVATFHANAERSRMLRMAAPLLRPLVARIDRTFAVSAAAAGYVSDAVGISRPEILSNGLDLSMFGGVTPADLGPGRKVLFVNRLDPRKGFPVLVRAFEEVSRRLPDVRLVVAGDGPDRGALFQLPELVRRRVILLGAVPHHAIATVYAACDVFVAPATGGESFGIVLLEAMAAGLPIVASAIAGYTEVVRPDEGLLVPPRDSGRLAAAIVELFSNQELAARLRAAGTRRAQDFAWDTMSARLESAYESAIAAAAGRAAPAVGAQPVPRIGPLGYPD
jgi:phosphatidyl-myo-inositol alpha-mannosyltransferase